VKPSYVAWGLAAFAAMTGCRGQPSEDPPVVPIRNMYNQPRYNPQQRSDFFEDRRTMRPAVPGTVSREMDPDLRLATGREPDNSAWVLDVPAEVVTRLGDKYASKWYASRSEGESEEHFEARVFLSRGQERYGVYCAPCHGISGHGNGIVANRASSLGAAALMPPSFHEDRLRHVPDGQVFATITNGIRNMPAYKHAIPTDDRWAIVAYVRALQLSQEGQKAAMNTAPTDGENKP
jgi:hypothetical protein